MSWAEVSGHVLDGDLPSGDCELTPASLAWPMSFGWSSFIAQNYVVDCCFAAGFEKHQLLTEEVVLLPEQFSSLSVATDDAIHFWRASHEERASITTTPLSALDAVWKAHGLLGNDTKPFDLQSSAPVLGVHVEYGIRLLPKRGRVADLLPSSHYYLRSLSRTSGTFYFLDSRDLLEVLRDFLGRERGGVPRGSSRTLGDPP